MERNGIARLLEIMRRLRDRERGCPWDIEQDFESIAPYTIEEAYEVADAIARQRPAELREELGDLLFQVVYHAQMAAERGWFDFEDVVRTISDKMVRRHPHVFGTERVESAAAQRRAWEEHKAAERRAKAAAAGGPGGLLEDLPRNLPALLRARKLQERVTRAGFDWPEAAPVLDKLEEEIGELRQELASGADRRRCKEELGDLFFTLVNLARKLDIDPEHALRNSNARFEQRFRQMEEMAGGPERLRSLSAEEREALWEEAKRQEAEDR